MNYNDDFYTLLGQRIRTRRKELHIKQCELAKILSMSENHVSSVENGKERPSLDMLMGICNILNVTPDYLLLGNMKPNDIPSNIVDSLRLCSKEDIELTSRFVELLINRNSSKK